MQSLPVFLSDLLKEQYDADSLARIQEGFLCRRPVTLRVNLLKSHPDRVKSALEKAGIGFQTVPYYSEALILKDVREPEIQKLPLYAAGEIYLQSLSSMIPPLLLSPAKNECILDMAAAPGGKTTQMAALSENRAQITACEKNRIRCDRLRYNLEKQGASRVMVLMQDARKLDPYFSFDKILLDAPCSGSGTLCYATPQDARLHAGFGQELIDRSARTQAELLDKALSLLKPGGILLYSTCSILKSENEQIVKKALAKKNVRLLSLTDEMPGEIPLLPTQLEGTCCICPTALYEGFFVAKLEKL